MSDESPLSITRDGPVVRAVMDRPARRNALSEAMGAAWDRLLADLAGDGTARVLVIGGAAGHFCAGLDLTEVASSETPEQKLARQQVRNRRTGATRLVLEGRVIDANEAARIGLVHQVAADAAGLEVEVQAAIAAVLEGAPGALAETKALLAALGPISPDGYAEAGAAAFARTASSPEATEGIAAFKAKRKPAWAGG